MIPRENLEHSVTAALAQYDNIEVILLKGHLILEQALWHVISAHQLDWARVEQMNLMFSKTLELAMALDSRSLERHYPHLKEINRIRNKLAHTLFFDNYHGDLQAWASGVLDYTPRTIDKQKTYKNHVVKAFALLAGTLLGVADGIEAVKSPN